MCADCAEQSALRAVEGGWLSVGAVDRLECVPEEDDDHHHAPLTPHRSFFTNVFIHCIALFSSLLPSFNLLLCQLNFPIGD